MLLLVLATRPALAVPSMKKLAARHGLAMGSRRSPTTRPTAVNAKRGSAGRTPRVAVGEESPPSVKESWRPRSTQDGLTLQNGRERCTSRRPNGWAGQAFNSPSDWKARGVRFRQETRVWHGETLDYSQRVSGNHYLRRVTRPGQDPAAPYVFTNGGLGADINHTIASMAEVAKSLDHDIVVDINAVNVVAKPGETAAEITARARAMNALR